MNEYVRLIKLPKGWNITSLQRKLEETNMNGSDVYVEYWEATVSGPDEVLLTVTAETKKKVLENIFLAVNNERHIH